jgi:NitT/TauT family transport system substrate-binding protein
MKLKIAVLPTLDCLPLFVAQQEQLLDTLNGGVRLKMYQAQMDCDTALERHRVEGMVTDLIRAMRPNDKGTKIRYVAVTGAYWQLIANRLSRIRQIKQLNDKMIGMTRFSATDLLSRRVADSVKLNEEHLFKIQVNSLNVRMQMLQNNEIDAVWLTEPQATMARLYKHPVIFDSRSTGLQLGVIAFREQEMRRQARGHQLQLLVEAYNKACDLINEKGVKHYKKLIMDRCQVRAAVVDSLPSDLRFEHARGPRQQDMEEVRGKKDEVRSMK